MKILHAGESEITLVDENDSPVVLKRQLFEGLVHQGKITNLQTQKTDSIQEEAWEVFQMASPEDRTEALCRYEIIKPYLEGNPPEKETTPRRTIRHWKSKYINAKRKYNCGLIGLLSRRHAKGNRTQKLSQETKDSIDKVISENYETIKQKNILSVYGSLLILCEEQGIQEPSYFTFTKKVHNRSTYEQTKARQGRRAAYQHKKFYWELSRTTPRHGDRYDEICHIDHTEADIELVSSETGRNLARPWLTLLTDAYSRRILAVYLTFDPPSYRSCLMVLRVCVKRHGRMPQTIVVDNGAEFNSTYFETLLAATECNKKQRPPAQARFGSVCERLFGTTNTQFFNNLKGNTQITRNVRQVTKSVNPKNHAVWTLAFLYDHLCHWAYEIYDTTDHPALDQTPQETFAQGMLQGGERSHLIIPYNKEFCMLTLPTTSKGKAQIKPGKGVKINYIYYWSNFFRDPELENTSVSIKYDPFNIGIAYAFVKGQWVECVSQYHADFRQHSERELKLASTELRKRKQNYSKNNKVSAKKLANFITSVEGQEFLLEQRSKDLETQKVIQIIEGNLTPITQYRKDRQMEKVAEIEPEYTELKSYAVSESSLSDEDSNDDNEFDFSFDELKIYDEF